MNISIFRAKSSDTTEIDMNSMYETLINNKIEISPILSIYELNNVKFTRVETTNLVSRIPS